MFSFRRRVTPPTMSSALDGRRADSLAYELLLLRSMDQESQTWQTPSLAMTAIAFLLTIALDPNSQQTARVMSASLATLVALIATQLMAKHKFLAGVDRAAAAELEVRLGLPPYAERLKGQPGAAMARWPVSVSSYRVWVYALLVFAAVSLSIVVISVGWPDLISAHPAAR